MPIEQIDIENFLRLSNESPILDVRSPGEFSHAHIPGAVSLPLFTDEQRKIIGTAYKQQSRQIAVKMGLEYFSERMKLIPEEVEEICKSRQKAKLNGQLKSVSILLHCWRGGMRSGAVAWLLNLYGFKVYTLKGGYKAFRKWALAQFENEYKLNILGGYTGSGKTMLLQEMKKVGNLVIDLEKLANHKGSAFGSLGEEDQPTQEMFENLFATELYKAVESGKDIMTNGEHYTKNSSEIWLEDESRHIGRVGIPNRLWDAMRKSPLYFLDIPFEERLKHVIEIYGRFEKEELEKSILRIQKRLGGLETKKAINFLHENNLHECFSILLKYYDKFYMHSLYKRENLESVLNKISCATVDLNNARTFYNQSA
ncbi:tRNA 2-selenouridine(34) synthase MnmH [Ginsengibacter hankyongi]|uniref:tRNA 2-selenouridine(34) synthase MnmH n=1 Tax=Ginsengibacter hankyongi TaxID=2607284 RepID=A0A5J5IMQ1_9BACT|nr:tRNA 2-selenouridine(34) synthase MnmH [Ginsengibacter hankyongi]KAA9041971.1 tRNA 2-selenouridine(34) synthase MnmH [Ginsengibacter hankyongi]